MSKIVCEECGAVDSLFGKSASYCSVKIEDGEIAVDQWEEDWEGVFCYMCHECKNEVDGEIHEKCSKCGELYKKEYDAHLLCDECYEVSDE